MAKAEKTASVLSEYTKAVEKQKAELAKFTESLKERRNELLSELREIEKALGLGSAPVRSSSASSGEKNIRWGSKNNTWIAEAVANAKNGISMSDLKAAAKKDKLNEMSIYQAVRSLVKAGGLEDEGGVLKAGANFPPSK